MFDLGAPDFSGEMEIRPVSRITADAWFTQYHYTGTSGGSALFWGAFTPDLMAVVGIGQPSNDHGLADKFDLRAWNGNLEINRVAVHPAAQRNTASRVVAAVLVRCVTPQGIDWVFSYADTGQNHHGGIYQALNAVYVGCSPPVYGWLLDGKPIHPRSVVSRYGTNARVATPELARARGEDLVYVEEMNAPKHTYILPIARDKRTRQAIRDHLAPYSKPYPKRAVAASSDAAVFQTDEAGSQPSLSLQLSR